MKSAVERLWSYLRRPQGSRRVLFVDDWLPDPRIGAGAPRALEFQRAIISAGASLVLFPTMTEPQNPTEISRLLPGAEVALGYGRQRLREYLTNFSSRFDVVVISRPTNMATFRASGWAEIRELRSKSVIYDAEAIFAERDAVRRSVLGEPMSLQEAARQIAQELALAEGSRMIVAVNRQTAAAFEKAGFKDVRVIGYSTALHPTTSRFDQRDGFLFVGPLHADDSPNTDAVIWFIDRVLPSVREKMGRDTPFVLAGNPAAPSAAARFRGATQSAGIVLDLDSLYSAARVFVAPTRYAAGIPLKVYDAAAHGVPIVLSGLLAEQLGWRHGEEALVADTPEQFAAECLRLHDDPVLWDRLRSRALQRVRQDCDPRRFNRAVAKMLAEA